MIFPNQNSTIYDEFRTILIQFATKSAGTP